MKYITLFIFLHLSIACISQDLSTGEGFVNVQGGRIWYKIAGSGKGIPLLIIHGGPGSRSCPGIPGYSALGNERPIIFYDQLGSGNSDRPTDTALWRLPRFVDEIEKLRNALNLKELHILGNSWGGAVLIEYMLTKPKGVKSVIFSGPLLSTPVWMLDAKILLAQLPKNLQDTIKKYEDLQEYNNPTYQAATDSFYARFLSVKPKPEKKIPSVCDSTPGSNKQIYNYMWGPTEFNATGTLKNFDRTGRLHEIKQPVLFIAGRYDEARPETMYVFQKKVPKSKVVIIEGAGHQKMIDQPLQFTEAIRSFLHSVK